MPVTYRLEGAGTTDSDDTPATYYNLPTISSRTNNGAITIKEIK